MMHHLPNVSLCQPAALSTFLAPTFCTQPQPRTSHSTPFCQGSLASYPPSGDYQFTGTGTRVTWSPDARFQSSLGCDASQQSYATLAPVDYASYGTFAIGVWLRLPPGGLAASAVGQFQYVLSHGAAGTSGSVIDKPDQVRVRLYCLFLVACTHPFAGARRGFSIQGTTCISGQAFQVAQPVPRL